MSEQLEFIHRSYITVVAMETVTLQEGGYLGLKAIQLKNDIGDPQILFHKMISLSILAWQF